MFILALPITENAFLTTHHWRMMIPVVCWRQISFPYLKSAKLKRYLWAGLKSWLWNVKFYLTVAKTCDIHPHDFFFISCVKWVKENTPPCKHFWGNHQNLDLRNTLIFFLFFSFPHFFFDLFFPFLLFHNFSYFSINAILFS